MPRRPSKSKRQSRAKPPASPRPATPSKRESAPPPLHSASPAAIHAPWRLEYLERASIDESRASAPGSAPGSSPVPPDNFLRDYWQSPTRDEQNHIIVRSSVGMILLNRFPYAAGHLLVALAEPRPTLLDYSPTQRSALWRHTDAAAAILQAALEPQGINIGVNQGRAAGAGVPHHLHVHLVPRWSGDVNFITVVGQIRVIPASLETMAQKFRAAWARIQPQWPLD